MDDSPVSATTGRFGPSGRALLVALAVATTYAVIGLAYSLERSAGPLSATTAALWAGLIGALLTAVACSAHLISRRAASWALRAELATAAVATAWFVLVSWSYRSTPHHSVSAIAAGVQVAIVWSLLRGGLRDLPTRGGVLLAAALVAASMVSLWLVAALNTHPNAG